MKTHRLAWMALGLALLFGSATAAQSPNIYFVSFGIDVTVVSQAFLLDTLITNTNANAQQCQTWLIENDDTVDTVWIAWSEPGVTAAVAVADTAPTGTDDVPNQMRLKAGQIKELTLFQNMQLAVIASGAAAHLHFEQNCFGR